MKTENAAEVGAAPAIDRHAKEAIAWEVRLRGEDATADDRDGFDVWQDADPANAQAWAILQERLGKLNVLQAASGNAVRDALQQPNRNRRRLIAAGTGLAVAVLTGVATRRLVGAFSLDSDFHNSANAPESIALADLRPITLGASARIYTENQPAGAIYLASGQVASDGSLAAHLPLTIRTRDGLVHSDRGQVSVDVLPAHTVVAVRGGDALLTADRGTRVRIDDGSAWSMSADRVSRMPESSTDILAWTRGTLIVQDRAVPDVVATLGRYFRGYIRFPEEGLSRRVSGVFPLQNVKVALAQLAEGLGFQMTFYGDTLAVASQA